MKSFFPVRLKYTDELESQIVERPEDIVSGKAFTILETNAE